jgi:hypothetical protein
MTYAAFRTSEKFWRSRPPANCPAARDAWDYHAKTGPIASMRLLDGLWMCMRPDGGLDAFDHSRDTTGRALRKSA